MAEVVRAVDKVPLPDPVPLIEYEPWQAEMLAEGHMQNVFYNFCYGRDISVPRLTTYFSTLIQGTLAANGSLYTVYDTHGDPAVVLGWRHMKYEIPKEYHNEIEKAFVGPTGNHFPKYQWYRNETDIPLGTFINPRGQAVDPQNAMRPSFIAVRDDLQGQGYGGHILRQTLDQINENHDVPMLVASTVPGGRMYRKRLDFHPIKGVFRHEYPNQEEISSVPSDSYDYRKHAIGVVMMQRGFANTEYAPNGVEGLTPKQLANLE